MKRVLAISSAGGHWEQLILIRACFDGADVTYATTIAGLAEHSGLPAAKMITDCNQRTPLRLLRCAGQLYSIIRHQRPHIIITTGAAPGLLALGIGRLYGARTIWIDSVANSERLSLSGRLAKYAADVWLTQWQHLATAKGPLYLGSVL